MRTSNSAYTSPSGETLAIVSSDDTLTVMISGTGRWTMTAGADGQSEMERQADAIASELRAWADEARARRMAARRVGA